MTKYIVRRFLMMIPVLALSSMLIFFVSQLPPGDFVDSYIAEKREVGIEVSAEEAQLLRQRFNLDQPVFIQYARWIAGVLRGDFGNSLRFSRPVIDILAERFPYSALMAIISFIIHNIIAISVGVYVAAHQYSFSDYVVSFICFLGVGIPSFVLSLVLLWFFFKTTGNATVGLQSQQFMDAPWSIAKILDLMKHMIVPMLVSAATGTAGGIRSMRANMLDEMNKPYTQVARAKGVPSTRMLLKYPFRLAVNPFIVSLGGVFSSLIGGELMVSVTLGIPTMAPIMVQASKTQDMYLCSSILLVETLLSVLGILFSDIMLAVVDPRIKDSV